MAEENKKDNPSEIEKEIKNIHPVSASKDMEKEDLTETQKKIEEQVAKDEKTLTGDKLSTALSRNRTHMSEHRTGLSEHRTDLSEHRTGLSEHRTDLSEHRTGLSEHRTDLSEHRTNLSDTRTHLSYERTALSYERTLMSWIRTATALFSFGFTIYKFFQEVQKESAVHRLVTPRMIGIIMIGYGVLGLLFAQIQHQIAYKKLKKEYPELQRSLSSILSVLMLIVGLFLFFAALFRQ